MALTKVSFSMISSGFVNASDFGVVGNGTTDDTTALQAALDSLVPYQTLLISANCKITATLNITNKTDIRITGGGRIFLSGASSSAVIFNLVGTINNLEIDNLTLVGDGNSGYTQAGIANNSGQTISNVRFHDNNISNINVGISCNADLSGTYTNAWVYNNSLKNISGTVPGSGYGIHQSKCSNWNVYSNTIDNASRHSIYCARGVEGSKLIQGNLIINHRKDIASADIRPAIVVARSRNVSVIGNKLKDCYDGCLLIDHDDADANSETTLVANNSFVDRKNTVGAIYIGSQSVPATYTTAKILITGNMFECTGAVGAGDIVIFNGTNIKISDNQFRYYSVSSSLPYPVILGDSRFVSSDAQLENIVVTDNFATSDNYYARAFAYISAPLCTGASPYVVKNNVFKNLSSEYYFETNPVNLNSKLKFKSTVTYTFGTIAANGVVAASVTVTGAKPTSQVTVRPEASKVVSPEPMYQAFAKDSGPNLVEILAMNSSASSSSQVSQDYLLCVEDF